MPSPGLQTRSVLCDIHPGDEPTGDFNGTERRVVQQLEGRTTSPKLRKTLSMHDEKVTQVEIEDETDHGHHERPPSLIAAVASGFINYLLMFGLCCAYGMIMFDENHARHRAIGVKMNLACAGIFGLLLATTSRVRVAIGGPDLNPVVFLANMISSISVSLASQHSLDLPESGHGRLLWQVAGRGLAGGGGGASTFCTGALSPYQQQACDEYHLDLRATAIFAVSLSSLLLAVLFYCVGYFKWTRYASYVPTCVMEAFLSCVGYKVFKYALGFCHYEPKQFIPAACVGVPLYFLKAYHIGNPAVVIPSMLIVPLVIYYIAVYGSGSTIETQEHWMFPEMVNIGFWHLWTDSLGSYGRINFQAWLTTLPELIIMLLVCFMDCVLKIIGTEGKLPIKVNRNYEMKLFGLGNLLTTLCGSPVGYMQLKFNVINFGIVGNATDFRGGLLYAVLCAATFFTTINHFNYLPRFFLGIMLFFAGSGFLAENLWGSRAYLSFREWMQIFVILVVFILTEKLLYAVMTGVLLTCIDLAVTYAKVRCVASKPMQGNESSVVRRHPLMLSSVLHISNSYVHVVRFKGFIFFASAQRLFSEIQEMMDAQDRNQVPAHRRLRFIIFDCYLYDGMDSSSKKGLRKLAKEARAHRIKVYWSHVTPEFAEQLKTQEIIYNDHQWFSCLDEAIQAIEERLVSYREHVQERWVNLHAVFQLQQKLATAQTAFEPFKDIFLTNAARRGVVWHYCKPVEIHQFKSLLWQPGQLNVPLYLVHKGSVALFRELPNSVDAKEWSHPVAIYHQGWFLNRECLIGYPTRYFAIAMHDGELVSWTTEQLTRMAREKPRMFASIQRAAMKQQAKDCDLKDQQFDQTAFYSDGEWAQEQWHGRRPFLPEQVSNRLKGIQVAEALAAARFYDKAEYLDTLLPELPSCIHKDLEIAFSTFCESPPSGGDAALPESLPPTISWDQAGRALLYAGIFNVGLHRAGISSLTEQEFLELGHEAAMYRLGKEHTETLVEVFRTRIGSADELFFQVSYSEFCVLLELVMGCKVDAEDDELLSLCDEWEDSCANGIDEQRFLALVSRLLRLHEQDWTLLRAIQSVADTKDFKEGCNLASEQLVEASATPLTPDHAEEMMWIADWRTGGQGGGKTLEFCDLVAALVMPVRGPVGKLPPPPKTRGRSHVGSVRGPAAHLLQRLNGHGPLQGSNGEFLTDDGKDEPCKARGKKLTDLLLDLNAGFPEAADPWLRSVSVEPSPEDDFIEFDCIDEIDARLEETIQDDKPNGCREKLYLFLEEPNSSRAAHIFWLIMGMLIILSVLTMVLQPLVESGRADDVLVWFYLDAWFTGLFSVEYVLRFSVADAFGESRLRFAMAPSNVCDLLAILPLYIDLILGTASEQFRLLRLVRLLRLTRISRIARLAKKIPVFGPIAMVLVVVWFIFMKTDAQNNKL